MNFKLRTKVITKRQFYVQRSHNKIKLNIHIPKLARPTCTRTYTYMYISFLAVRVYKP